MAWLVASNVAAFKGGSIYMISGSGDPTPAMTKSVFLTSQVYVLLPNPANMTAREIIADPRGGYDYLYFVRGDFGFTNEIWRIGIDGSSPTLIWDLTGLYTPTPGEPWRIAWNYGNDGLLIWPVGSFGQQVMTVKADGTGVPTFWQPFPEMLGGWWPAPCSACCTFSDGRFAGWSSYGGFGWRKLRWFTGFSGVLGGELTPAFGMADNWGWGAEDNIANVLYFTDSGGGNVVGKWNLTPNTAQQINLAWTITKPMADTGGGYFYLPPGSSTYMRRRNLGTSTWTSWDGTFVPVVEPTMEQIMKHGKWFNGGYFRGCWLGWR